MFLHNNAEIGIMIPLKAPPRPIKNCPLEVIEDFNGRMPVTTPGTDAVSID
jgi:hypothetical protein